MVPAGHHPVHRARSRAAGFTVVEFVVAMALLTLSVLANVASTGSARDLAQHESERGIALEALTRFIERLRADPDWAGLYLRLRSRSRESTFDTARTHLGADPTLPTYDATAYYADLEVPRTLGTVTFLVQVPAYNPGVLLTPTLREDQPAPRYGLPADLNGDGVVAPTSRTGDYRVLPVVVRIRWQRRAQDPQEIVLSTWLRGER